MPSKKTLSNIEHLQHSLTVPDIKIEHYQHLTNKARYRICVRSKYMTLFYSVTDTRLSHAEDFDTALADVLANPHQRTVVTFDPREIYLKAK